MEQKFLKWVGDYCSGRLTGKESRELKCYLKKSEDISRLFYQTVSDIKVYEALSAAAKATGSFVDILNKVKKKKQKQILLRWSSVAAVIVITILISLTQVLNLPEHQEYRILPGSTKATLQLADGRTIDLTQENLNLVAAQCGLFSVDEQHCSISYDSRNNHTEKPVCHSITVPIGGEYHFILPDGTEVWLNSDSKITYPTSFTGTTRSIKLQGEAYFEVAKDVAHPFIVEFGKAQLEVTGTRFSVSAYPEFSYAMATLEEGGINVKYNGSDVSLAPGKQAVIDKRKEMLTSCEVRTSLYTSWVKGIFEYENMKLHDIAVQLSRWYDVDFHFTSQEAKDSRFTGVVIKYHDLNEALALIEKTSGIRFVIEAGRVTVENH